MIKKHFNLAKASRYIEKFFSDQHFVVENGQIWPWFINKDFPFITLHLFKELMEYVSPVLMRNLQMTCPGYRPVCGLVRTRYCHVTTHPIHYWLARNSKILKTGDSFQTRVSLSLLTSPQASREASNHREGEPGFFLTPNTWIFHQLSNSQQSRGRWLSVNIWYYICGVSADATGWVMKTVLTSDASHVDSHYHVLPSDWKWHFLWPQYHAQKLSWTSDQTKETSYSLSSL